MAGRGLTFEAAPQPFHAWQDVPSVQDRIQARRGRGRSRREGSLQGLGTKADVDHSLVHYWLKTYHAGELSLDLMRVEASVETAHDIAAPDTITEVAAVAPHAAKGGAW